MQRKTRAQVHEPQEEIFNNPKHTHLRRQLRKNQTEPERRLWAKIRNRQLGVKFRRQHGIGNYIVDFYCPECKLVIELDGDSHFSPVSLESDGVRDKFLGELNLRVLRFTNREVTGNLNSVLTAIFQYIKLDTLKTKNE